MLHQIGAGALGPVFRAYETSRERLVAVKVFNLDLPPDRVHRLVAELERLVAAELDHPGIAAPLATGIEGVAAYIAQDYVAAESLDTIIRDHGPAPVADAVRVATQLAGALDYAAAVQIAHGALHPRDVLVSADDVRITGLGIARALQRVGVTAPVRRPYTAPERVSGGEWDRRADVFSLAALMHDMLWGRRVAAVGKEAADSVAPLVGADLDKLRAAFSRALAERPADRFGTALQFAEALANACHASAPSPAVQPPVPGPSASVVLRLPLDASDVVEQAPVEMPDFPSEKTEGRRLPPQQEQVPDADALLASVDLRAAEEARYEEVETAPAIAPPVEPPTRSIAPPFEPPTPSIVPPDEPLFKRETDASASRTAEASPPFVRGADSYQPPVRPAQGASQSAVWPLAMALLIGLAVGFAGAYFFATRDRSAAAPVASTAVGTTSSAATSGQAATPSSAVSGGPTGTAAARAGDARPSPSRSGSEREFTEGTIEPAQPSRPTVPAERTPPAATAQPPVRAEANGPNRTPPPRVAAGAPARSTAAARPTVREQPREPATQPANDGRLLVRSTPAGARVLVDGRERGTTPAVVLDLPRGAHRVRVLQDGYAAEERRVTVTDSQPAQSLTIELVPLRTAREPAPARTARADVAVPPTPGTAGRFVGSLVIESRPTGATVFVDGRQMGTTPMALPELTAGAHVVRLERDGYRRWSSSVRVVADEQNRVTASLER